MPNPNAPYHPIIYVRGYAMSRGEIDQTTADPFCGFNLGSTIFRAQPERDKPAKKFIFESPVVRLVSDFSYEDVFRDGLDIMDPGWTESIGSRSIIVYHYYEQASSILGTGKTPEIETFARGLSELIIRTRELVCRDPNNGVSEEEFRCYLVAHSMGGLVCRAFLQNPDLGDDEARQCVDKFFTYATPHNGIDMAGLNVPTWLSANDLSNFNRDRMAEYLNLRDLYKHTGRVDWISEDVLSAERIFCMIGTNRADYEAAAGLSRSFAGHGSDGLVRIENASICGVNTQGEATRPSARAYAYRSHSGFFGIVNSEESYQNLARFLFGDVRADVWVDVGEVRLPEELQAAENDGKTVGALYQFEVLASPRGKLWYLTRRVAEEDSVATRSHEELKHPENRSLYLSSVFLGNKWRVNKGRASLAYGLTLGVRVPDYEVDRKFWPDQHFEGGYLFRDTVVIEMIPPQNDGDGWLVEYDWQSDNLGKAATPLLPHVLASGKLELTIPFDNQKRPGISGKLRFITSAWNA